MRMAASICGALVAVACVSPTLAQVAVQDPWQGSLERPRTVSDLLARLNDDGRFADPDVVGAVSGILWAPRADVIQDERELRFETARFQDRLRVRSQGRLRRADGAPLPPGPLDAASLETDRFDVVYTRGWTETLGHTDNGLDVTLTPHVGLGVGSRGRTTEAGATLKIGPDLHRVVRNGQEAFGDRPRWYVYAAGSGTAVGYNFARDRDGDFARSGLSKDEGAFFGDASIGLALRRGPIHSSVGLIYREIEVENARFGAGVDTDVSEGLLAFQLSIKPE